MMSSHNMDVGANQCRICHSVTSTDLIKSPCFCKGSLAYVHFICLERWLNYASRDSCELCSFQFNVVLNRRYTFSQSIRLWMCHPANRTFILCDLTIGLALTILTLILMMICFSLNQLAEQDNNKHFITGWSEGALNFFMIIMLAGYIATIYSMVKDHTQHWYRWWVSCNTVKLVYDRIISVPQPLQKNKKERMEQYQLKEEEQMKETNPANFVTNQTLDFCCNKAIGSARQIKIESTHKSHDEDKLESPCKIQNEDKLLITKHDEGLDTLKDYVVEIAPKIKYAETNVI